MSPPSFDHDTDSARAPSHADAASVSLGPGGVALPTESVPARPALRHETAMVDRPGFLFRLLGRLFERVRFAEEEVEKIRDLQRSGRIVYALRSESLLDYLFFNWAFLRKGLPLAIYGQSMAMWPWRTVTSAAQRLWRWVTRRSPDESAVVESVVGRGEPALVFLEPARSLLRFRAPVDRLKAVARGALVPGRPCYVLPLLIVWDRAPSTLRRTLADVLFGDYDHPGRSRKLLNFLGSHRQAFVQVGDPVDVRAEVGDTLDGADARLRFAVESRFATEQRIIKGPVTKTAAQIGDELLRSEPVGQDIREVAEHDKLAPAAVRDRVEHALREIAADPHPGWVEFLCYVLTFVFGRIYGGIELDGLQPVRELAKKMPIVVLPSHKSHLDYLLISYLFYTHGLVVPHIAAGSNLNFWPVGHIFRHAGAFFIRRSFKQDEAYSRTLRAYLQKLLKEGHTVEFFIEGTRSRTGKLLKPRYGLLAHVVDAVAAGHVHDVALCPTAVGYEMIVEGQSYAKELGGGSKESENVGQLMSAAMVLRERFGRVHVSFAEPMSLRQLLEARGVDLAFGFRSEEERRETTKAIAYRVLGGINGAVRATASSIVSFVILSTVERGISRRDLRARVGALVDYLLRRDVALASSLRTPLAVARLAVLRLPSASPPRPSTLRGLDGRGERAIGLGAALAATTDEAIALFIDRRHVIRHAVQGGSGRSADGADDIIEAVADRRVFLDFNKNYVVHALASEAIVALALLSCRRAEALFADRLEEEARFLSGVLKNEYVFETAFAEAYAPAFAEFVEAGLIVEDRSRRLAVPNGALSAIQILASTVSPVVEGYFVTIRGVLALTEGSVAQPALAERLQADGTRLWHTGAIAHREAVSSVVFDNAMTWLEERGFVAPEMKPVGRRNVRHWARTMEPARLAELTALEARLSRIISRASN